MTRLQVIACSKWLEERSVEVDGQRSYAEGWSDERIAEAMNAADPNAAHKMAANHVATLRYEIYPDWRLKTIPKNPVNGAMKILDRLASIEARLQALEDAATAPRLHAGPQSYANGFAGQPTGSN